MRLRHTVGAALGALALLVTLPTPADAATGFVLFQYGDPLLPKSTWQSGQLENPPADGVCYNLPEVQGHPLWFGIGPNNAMAEETVYVFTEVDCLGVRTKVDPGVKKGNNVIFKSYLIENLGG
ncbi:hypothetical protein [Streptomyces sp. MMG1121]|uniref:hypothetical protein n=1 Tax=Streptomyces sp. MMG1121 TaxID=1415544 RepID=UPI0006AEE418|nr:hypothetical protein [Streptomyces sp. MMG1121]